MRALVEVRRGWWVPLAMAAVVVALAGCTGGSPAPRAAGASPVPLQQIDLSGVSAIRAPFCRSLDENALAGLLGARPWRDASYAPGQRVRLAPGLRDVAHEYGCEFRKRGITARAWLFAQPVTARQARGYVAERRRVAGCSSAGDLRFGSPGVVQLCRPARGAGTSGAAPHTELARMAGLFGSGYLTCQVSTSPGNGLRRDALLTRTERWCASVAVTVGKP